MKRESWRERQRHTDRFLDRKVEASLKRHIEFPAARVGVAGFLDRKVEASLKRMDRARGFIKIGVIPRPKGRGLIEGVEIKPPTDVLDEDSSTERSRPH